MNIRFLETVLCLSQLRTIKATAEKLCITDTAVSSRIAAIEQDLGVRLFVRGEKGFLPSKQGEEFIKAAEGIVSAYYELRKKMLDPDKVKGRVRIGVVATVGMTIFPTIAQTLREKFPQVSLSITTDLSPRLFEELKTAQLDISLSAAPPALPNGMQDVHLCAFGMQFISSPRLGIKSDVPLSPDTLSRYPIIGYPKGTESQDRIEEYFRDVESGALHVHASNSITTTLHMVSAGLGIAAVPIILVTKEIAEGSLIALPALRPFPTASYSAIYYREESTGVSVAVAAIARESARVYCDQFDSFQAKQVDY